MIRILVFIILAAIALVILYFQIKTKNGKKRIALFGIGSLVAATGLMVQAITSTYLAVLAVIALSLIVSMIYAKKSEESQPRTRMVPHKKVTEKNQEPKELELKRQAGQDEPAFKKSIGMQKIGKIEGEQKVEQ